MKIRLQEYGGLDSIRSNSKKKFCFIVYKCQKHVYHETSNCEVPFLDFHLIMFAKCIYLRADNPSRVTGGSYDKNGPRATGSNHVVLLNRRKYKYVKQKYNEPTM